MVRGGPQHDDLSGNAGNDILVGGPQGDYLSGDKGNDQIWGGRGQDFLSAHIEGEPGRDWVFMGPDGDKVFIEDDGQVDHIDCGRGTDWVYVDFEVDPLDVFVDCERFI